MPSAISDRFPALNMFNVSQSIPFKEFMPFVTGTDITQNQHVSHEICNGFEVLDFQQHQPFVSQTKNPISIKKKDIKQFSLCTDSTG